MTPIHDMVLVPRPRVVDTHGRGAQIDGLEVRERITQALPDEGFRLSSSEDGVRLEHRDPSGLRYAHQLLDQVISQCADGRLPGFTIEDSPDIPVRAVMVDISRDRVPTWPTLQRLVELCSLARINQLQLYMEHSFAHPTHRVVWQHASPLTPAHMSWLDHLCADHGIELVANQNTFGHMGRWLCHDDYRQRAECPDGWEPMPGMRLRPEVLAPTPDNAAFALDLVDDVLECVRSKRVNIGCDEPFELGHGVSHDLVADRGIGRVYLDHVRRLADPLLDRGYEVQVWADVLTRHPNLAADLPAGVVPIAWCYEAPTPDGQPRSIPQEVAKVLDNLGIDLASFSGFEVAVAPLVDAGVPFWVAPGTSSWNSLVGRIDNARANLVDAAVTARTHGCGGYLITDWGDNGHHQPPSVSFGPLVYGGAVAWGLEANLDLGLDAVLDRFVFQDPTGSISIALDVLGREWDRTGQEAINASPLNAALFPDQLHLVMGEPDRDAVHDVVARIAEALDTLGRATPGCDDGALVVRELSHAARMARHGAWRLLGGESPSAANLAEDMAALAEAHCVTWMARSRPGGLLDSLSRLDPYLRGRGRSPATATPVPTDLA